MDRFSPPSRHLGTALGRGHSSVPTTIPAHRYHHRHHCHNVSSIIGETSPLTLGLRGSSGGWPQPAMLLVCLLLLCKIKIHCTEIPLVQQCPANCSPPISPMAVTWRLRDVFSPGFAVFSTALADWGRTWVWSPRPQTYSHTLPSAYWL